MFGLLSLAVTIAAVAGGFIVARDFVVRRLRFVDGVRSPLAPWIAGIGVALVAWPVAILPIVTTFTTTLLGVAAGFGTASGVKALKRGT
ncbi:MAG: hypothetical protein E4H38_00920 [Gemmatimonadales bacterium]|nr:MAG: hypothetical protein E4H38_00920 [Gemmatimonadales bacterium]